MSKVLLVLALLVGLSACEAYPGRTTNCWGGAKLFLEEAVNATHGCQDWVAISE